VYKSAFGLILFFVTLNAAAQSYSASLLTRTKVHYVAGEHEPGRRTAAYNLEYKAVNSKLYTAGRNEKPASSSLTGDRPLLNEILSNEARPSAVFTWTGSTSNDYNTGSNWDQLTVPGNTDDIVISSSATNPCVINSGSFTVNNLTINGTGDFRMATGTSLTISNNVVYASSIAPLLDCSSTIVYNKLAALTIPAWDYGNLTCAANAVRAWSAADTTGICGVFTPGATTLYTATVGSVVDYKSLGLQTIQSVKYYDLVNTGNGPRTYKNVADTIDIANKFIPTTGAITYGIGNTINFSSNGPQTIPTTVYYNIANTGTGSRTLAPSGANSNKITVGNFLGFNPIAARTVTNSTVEWTGFPNFLIAGITYHNLIFNCRSGVGTFNLASGTTLTVNGDLTIMSSTGTSTILNIGAISTATFLTVGGNVYIQDKGILQMISLNTSTGATANIAGNVTISGSGKINLEPVSSAAAGIINITGNFISTGTSVAVAGVGGIVDWGVTGNLTGNAINIKGNFSHNGAGSFGASTISAATPATGFVFNNTGTTQTFSYTSANVSQKTNYVINTAAAVQMLTGLSLGTGAAPPSGITLSGTLDCGSQVITAADATNNTFTINTNAVLKTAHVNGVMGSLAGFGAANITGNNGIFQFAGTVQNTGFPPAVTAANRLDWLGNTSLTLNQSFQINNPGNINYTNSGLFYLGNSNLTVGVGSVITGAPFSTAKMFVTNGNGQLIRNYSSTGSGLPFTWPIGETTGTTEYSPVTVNSIAVSSAGTIGFRVVDAVHPNVAPSTGYLSRYWNYSYTGGAYTLGSSNFTYDPSDIVTGPEALLKASSWDAFSSSWTVHGTGVAAANVLTIPSGVTSANLFTGNDITARVDGLLYYRSAAAGPVNWSNTAAWQVSTDPAFISPAAQVCYTEPTAANSESITIRAGHTINITSTASADQLTIAAAGILNIDAGGTLNTADGTATDIAIGGALNINTGGTLSTAAGSQVSVTAGGYLKNAAMYSSGGSLVVDGTYEHALDGGTITTASWNAGSICNVTGIANTAPAGLGQNFYDLVWNCNQSADIQLANTITGPIQNDFTVAKTNGFDLWMANTQSVNLSIGRDLNVTGGKLIMNGGSVSFTVPGSSLSVGRDLAISGSGVFQNTNAYASGFNVPVVNVVRDISMNGNTGVGLLIAGANTGFAATPSSATINVGRNFSHTGTGIVRLSESTAAGTMNVTGNFTHSNGVIDVIAGTAAVNFNGTTPQVYTSGGTITTAVNFTVNTNAILDMNTSFISGTGAFTLQNNSTLRIGSPDGIVTASLVSGNLRNSGARVLPAQASYIYNGTVSQSTGTDLPTFISGNLTIDNPGNVVTLITNNTTTTKLNLNAGAFNAGTNGTLIIDAGGLVVGNGGSQYLAGTAVDNVIRFAGNGAVQGTPELYNVTIGNSGGGVDFTNNARVNGNLLINSFGSINPNSPRYAIGSTLIYNTGGGYVRNVEWGSNIAGAPGYPHHVTIQNGTTLSLTNTTPASIGCGGDISIGNPSAAGNGVLDLSSIGGIGLNIGGDLNIGGTIATGLLAMSNSIGGDVYLTGSWNRTANGTVNFGSGNGRAVFFVGAPNASITASGGQTFPYVFVNKSAKTSKLTLADNVNITDEIGFARGTIDLAANNKFLNILSTAAKTARVGQSDSLNTDFIYGAGTTGQFIVQRYIPARRSWRLMTAPLKPTGGFHTISEAWQERGTPYTGLDYTTANWAASVAADTISSDFGTHITGGSAANGFDQSPTNNPSIKLYNSPYWVGPANINSTSINSQEGWMLFLRGDRKNYGEITNQYKVPTVTTLRPRGQVFIGRKSITSAGLTVVGNPYASAVDFNSMSRAGAGWPANPTYYVWDPYLGGANGQGAFVTLTWNGTYFNRSSPYGAGTYDDRYIPSGAAIMVDFPAGGGSLMFSETDKNSASTTTAYRPAPHQLMTVLNTVNDDGSTYVSDAALSLFGNDFNNEVDINDAAKLSNFTENFGLARDGKVLSIERRKMIHEIDTIFYNISKMQRKNYQFQFIFDHLAAPASTAAFLEDLYLNKKTPVSLQDTTNINFSIAINEEAVANRFRLVFRRSVVYNSIKATELKADIAVDWTVGDEWDVQQYSIERSTDNKTFTEAGTVSATGNNNLSAAYRWIDVAPQPGVYYYRIKSISSKGAVSYSDIVKIKILNSRTDLYVFPNPVQDNIIQLQLNDKVAGQYNARLFNSAGLQLINNKIIHAGATATFQLKPTIVLPAGTYSLEVVSPDKKTALIKVVVAGK
jgi:hypothetical protein